MLGNLILHVRDGQESAQIGVRHRQPYKKAGAFAQQIQLNRIRPMLRVKRGTAVSWLNCGILGTNFIADPHDAPAGARAGGDAPRDRRAVQQAAARHAAGCRPPQDRPAVPGIDAPFPGRRVRLKGRLASSDAIQINLTCSQSDACISSIMNPIPLTKRWQRNGEQLFHRELWFGVQALAWL